MPLAAFRRLALIVFAVSAAAFAVAAEGETREVKIEDVTLKVPADWQQQPPSNQLRLAQFVIPAAKAGEAPTEMVVSHFGGGGGGIDANIDRWIGQFASADRQVKVTKGASDQGTYYFVDVTGTYNMPVGPPVLRQTKPLPDARMAGVILETKEKGNYFLKMAGPEAAVSAAADDLRASIGGDKASEQPYELK